MRDKIQTKAELRAERDEWKKLAEKGIDPTLTDLRIEGGALSMALAGPIVERMAVLFVEYFRGLGASNYVEFNVHDRSEPFQRYTLTMQKVGALSPADKVKKLADALIAAEAFIDRSSGGGETDVRARLRAVIDECRGQQSAEPSTAAQNPSRPAAA